MTNDVNSGISNLEREIQDLKESNKILETSCEHYRQKIISLDGTNQHLLHIVNCQDTVIKGLNNIIDDMKGKY